MLQTQTINPKTLELLKEFCMDPILKNSVLAGGTALALQLGHRISVDLDMFCYGDFNAQMISDKLLERHGFHEVSISDTMVLGNTNKVKTDFVKARNRLIFPVIEEDGIRIVDMRDIAAMKLWAITRSASRLKDYLDIACLSTKMSLNEMLSYYEKAYNTDSSVFVIKKLTFYKQIENFESLKTLGFKTDWTAIKERLNQMILEPDRVFEQYPQQLKQKNIFLLNPFKRNSIKKEVLDEQKKNISVTKLQKDIKAQKSSKQTVTGVKTEVRHNSSTQSKNISRKNKRN